MHLDVPVPPEVAPILEDGWEKCFDTLDETVETFQSIGFKIKEADSSPDTMVWWNEYAEFDPDCKAGQDGEGKTIRLDQGRWLSFGHIIAQKLKADNRIPPTCSAGAPRGPDAHSIVYK